MVKKVKSISEAINVILNEINNSDHNNSYLRDETADAMREIIQMNVYDAFKPEQYERREDDGGFSDTNNMLFTDSHKTNNSVILTFENITRGNDSMSDERLDDLFENGNGTWENPDVYDEYGRKNSTPRPFIEDTIDELNYRRDELTNAMKKDLKNLGFDVK